MSATAWRSSGACHIGDDNRTSSPAMPPCCGHVTSVSAQLLPVGDDDEEATRWSGTTSSSSDARRHRMINSSSSSSSRPADDVINMVPASFPHPGHVTGSNFAAAAWCPAMLRAVAAALQSRHVNMAAARPDGVPPSFHKDLRRRVHVDDATGLSTGRPPRSADPGRGVPVLPV